MEKMLESQHQEDQDIHFSEMNKLKYVNQVRQAAFNRSSRDLKRIYTAARSRTDIEAQSKKDAFYEGSFSNYNEAKCMLNKDLMISSLKLLDD